jgi:hypothetical protein
MPFFYQSGQEIKLGDRVGPHGEAGEIGFVADPAIDPNDWYAIEFGGGVMVVEPKRFGRLFIDAPAIPNYAGLDFVSRRT